MMKSVIYPLLFVSHCIGATTLMLDSFEEGVATPKHLSLTSVSDTTLKIDWQKPDDIESYHLCYADKTFSNIGYSKAMKQILADFSKDNKGDCITVYTNNAQIRGLSKATNYHIVAIAQVDNMFSSLSNELVVNTDLAPPTLIRSKSFGAGNSEVNWEDNPDATGYTLCLSEVRFSFEIATDRSGKKLTEFVNKRNGKIYKNIAQSQGKVLLSNLTSSKEYFYVITSSRGEIEGYASEIKTLTALGDMNDTGITLTEPFLINSDRTCDKNALSNQDCIHGRDYNLNDNSDGVAGFSFTKIDKDGKARPKNDTEWKCVRDNVTGLVWEVKSNSSANIKYTQYLPSFGSKFDLNENRIDGGDDGIWAGIQGRDSTAQYIETKNREELCGFKDWRLPTRRELRSIVHYGQTTKNSAGKLVLIDLDYFPNTQPNDYWTSSPVADDFLSSWTVYFADGSDHPRIRDSRRRIRLVYGNQ